MNLLGAVLAGGRSRRMGADKALLRIDGEPLWRRQRDVLRAAGAGRVVLVRARGQPETGASDLVADRHGNCGPLAGLEAVSALNWAPWVAVLAVDMPWVGADWFRRLRGFCRPGVGAVAQTPDGWEPLAAIYPVEALVGAAVRLARRDLSLQRFVSELVSAGRLERVPLGAAESPMLRSLNHPP